MKSYNYYFFTYCLLLSVMITALVAFDQASIASSLSSRSAQLATPTFTPPPPQQIFNYPVFYRPNNHSGPDDAVSSYFDHEQTSATNLAFYNGLLDIGGFSFFCAHVPPQWFLVGCTTSQCSREAEMWYDDHKGVDFEYFGQWHSGTECLPKTDFQYDPTEFPVYAPASGRVVEIDRTDSGPNGAFIKIEHDVDGDGSYRDDNTRSVYLHFAIDVPLQGFYGINSAIALDGLIEEGDFLGYGASTGWSWTPHLHFEVQRAHIDFSGENGASHWSVDPFGWEGNIGDPWPHTNVDLWDYTDGDVNCDGSLTSIDALYVLQYIVGTRANLQYKCPLSTSERGIYICRVVMSVRIQSVMRLMRYLSYNVR